MLVSSCRTPRMARANPESRRHPSSAERGQREWERPDLRGFTGNVNLVCAEVELEQVADDLRQIADCIADVPEKISPGPRLLSAMGDQWAETVKLLADVTLSEAPPNFEYDAATWV